MRWVVWLFLVVVGCNRAAPEPTPAVVRGPIEISDEEGRPTLTLTPTDAATSTYALVDFTGHTFGTLTTGPSATVRDFEGNVLAVVAGDRVLDGAGTVLLTRRPNGAHTMYLQSDGHAAFVLQDDDEVTRDGLPVISPLKIRGTERRAVGRVLALAELPFEVRLAILGAHVL